MTTLDEQFAKLVSPLRVAPGARVHLEADHDPASTGPFPNKREGADLLRRGIELLADYQERLAAEQAHGVLICLQGIDASGKDGTIRHVMSGVNPQGVAVTSFKVPSEEELRHDYLWRYSAHLPRRGEIGIFNRSHYEEVVVVRVHPENLDRQSLPQGARGKRLWDQRFRQINAWERYLCENGFAVVKLFLNVSKEEQRRRFLKRLDLADHNWKFSASDARERAYWDDYQAAFTDALSRTSTEWAPWYVIPADHKWFARLCVAAVIVETLRGLDPQYPAVSTAERASLAQARRELEAEAPKGAPRDPYAGRRRSRRPRT